MQMIFINRNSNISRNYPLLSLLIKLKAKSLTKSKLNGSSKQRTIGQDPQIIAVQDQQIKLLETKRYS